QITIIAHSPLGRGLENIKRRDRNGALSQLAAATGHSEAQVALNWCVEQKNLIAVPKANSAARVLGNCGASGWSLSQEQVAFLEKSVKPFRRRGPTEVALRRVARRVLNRVRGTTHS
ncbi:MAG: aldo/keto reductase, partial [Rhodospirillales bacterium]|nr:aldo/keto reductase [Rhodospirillales bacterium]